MSTYTSNDRTFEFGWSGSLNRRLTLEIQHSPFRRTVRGRWALRIRGSVIEFDIIQQGLLAPQPGSAEIRGISIMGCISLQ